MLVPGAEPLVDRWRQRLDPVAVLGVPAHVTVLWPFVPPADLSAATHRELAGLFATEKPFRAELTGIGWFDEQVV